MGIEIALKQKMTNEIRSQMLQIHQAYLAARGNLLHERIILLSHQK